MTRKYIDCREFPSDMNCTVALSADSDKELMEAAVQHAVAIHQHQDTPELRAQLLQLFKVGTPPVEAPRRKNTGFALLAWIRRAIAISLFEIVRP